MESNLTPPTTPNPANPDAPADGSATPGADIAPDVHTDAGSDANKVQEVPVGEDHPALNADGELHPYYCPGCGRGYAYPAECSGTAGNPHQPTQTVSTDELHGDDHTAARASEG
jgi:hypothetical protein